MNIAIFTNNYIPFSGGVPTSIHTFKKAAEQKGHNVLIFAPSYPGHKNHEKNVFRIPSLEVPTYNGYRIPIPFLGKIGKKIKDIDIDVIHVHHPYLLGKKGLNIAKKRNIPIIFTHHTLYEKYIHYIPLAGRMIKTRLNKKIKKFCNQCDLIIAPSEYVENLLEKRNVKTKIKIIPTGINLENFKNIKSNIRKKYHLSKNSEILLYAGRITEEKNLPFLLKSMNKIVKNRPQSICFLAGESGDNKYEKKLLDFVKQNNLQNKIIFTGNLNKNELIKYYKEADIFLFSSKTETQGLVLLEAMAAGTPVITIRGPSVNYLIKDNFNGFLINENCNKYAEKVVSLLKNKKKLKEMSKNAKKTAENFSDENMADKLITEFKLLNNKKQYARKKMLKWKMENRFW